MLAFHRRSTGLNYLLKGFEPNADERGGGAADFVGQDQKEIHKRHPKRFVSGFDQGSCDLAKHTHTHTSTYAHTHTHKHIRAHTHTHKHIRTHTHTHTHAHTHTRTHFCMPIICRREATNRRLNR